MAAHTLTSPTLTLFRTFPFRYLGCGFPLAEALYFNFEEDHWSIDSAYTISGAFILTHVVTNAVCVKTSATFPENVGILTVLATGVGTLLWELQASVFLPCVIVNRISLFVSKRCPKNWPALPTIVGIASIPLIVYPLDMFVDAFMRFITPVGEYVVQ